MSNHQPGTLLHYVRRLIAENAPCEVSDGELLERFIGRADEAAFELLLWRHGPMVLGVCQRLLGHEQDAEDAFQAAFLALVRKSRTIGKKEAVASWLFKVAYRIACRAQALRGRREASALTLDPASPTENPDAAERDLCAVLDQEVDRLPERYRRVVVLCYLEGKTNEEASRLLGCPKGTVATRLSRARDALRKRLLRRGVTLPAAALPAVLTQQATASSLSPALVAATLRSASALASGKVVAGLVSANTLALVEGGLRAMGTLKIKIAAGVVLALALLGGGLSLAGNRFAGEDRAAGDGAAVAGAPGNPVAPVRQEEKPDPQAQLNALRRDLQRALHEIDALKSRLQAPPAKVKLFRGKPVDFWIDQLNDFDPSYRIEAVKVLGIIAAQEERAVLPVLAERVKDKSAKVADEAALALAKGGKAAVPWLLKLVEVDVPPGQGRRLAEQVRIRAIVGLRHVGPEAKEAVPALTQALKHSKDELGQAAIAALRDIGPAARATVPALIDVLARHLDDKESHVRNAVAQALMAIEPETASLLPESSHALGMPMATVYQPVTLRRDDPPGLWEKALQSLKKKYSEKKEP